MTRPDEPTLVPVHRAEQIRAAEQPLIDAGRGEELMRTAAAGLAACVREALQERGGVYGSRVTALVGSGNNGGDALYALSFLRRRGAAVTAVLLKDRAHQQGLAHFKAAGGQVVEAVPANTQVLVDAVLGTGFSGDYQPGQIEGLGAVRSTATVIACDLPSGVDADTGAAGDHVIAAEHTVTFGGLKPGLLVGAGGQLSGKLHLIDIGLGPHLPRTPVSAVVSAAPGHRQVTQLGSRHGSAAASAPSHQVLPALQRPGAADHKYSRGTVNIFAGSTAFPGAAQLTVGAAISTGAGMVTLAAPEAVRRQVLAAWPETVGAEPEALSGLAGASAIVIGPGLGGDPHQLAEAEAALERAMEAETSCVLDASGLGLIRNQLRRRGGLASSVLITPHLGEARRLAEDLRDPILTRMLSSGPAADPIEAARRLSGALDCAVLLKGATTVIAAPQGEVILHRAETRGVPGVPGLATAGTGDVLSGILGALAATQPTDWLATAAHAAQRHTAAAAGLDPHGEGSFGASALVTALARSAVPHRG